MDYRRLTYDQAQAEALNLMREAIESQRWFDVPEKLMLLRSVMQRDVSPKTGRLL